MTTLEQFLILAQAQIGVPYVFGGSGLAGSKRPGLDCSGLPFAVCAALGIAIPRTSEEQFAAMASVPVPAKGDLVFYNVPTDDQPQPAHIAIYWSATQVLQAPHTGEDVMFSPPLPYLIMGFRRIPFAPSPTPLKGLFAMLEADADFAVRFLYRFCFHREADPGGYATQLKALQDGTPIGVVMQEMQDSPEGQAVIAAERKALGLENN